MFASKLIFSQITDHLPMHNFRRCVARYQGDHYVKRFRCLDQYLIMAFAQLTHRESLRDIEACLRAHQNKLYHMGIRSTVSRIGRWKNTYFLARPTVPCSVEQFERGACTR